MNNQLESDQKKQHQEHSKGGCSFLNNIRFDRRLWDNEQLNHQNNQRSVLTDVKLSEFRVCLSNKLQSLNQNMKTLCNPNEKTNEKLIEENTDQKSFMKSSLIDTSLKAMSTSTKLSLRL